MSDEVSILIDNNSITGWKSVVISRSAESIPNYFSVTCAEPFPDEPTKIIAKPGSPVVVRIGNDTVITGFVDRYDPSMTAHSHDVTITGRGLCQDLVDCSVDILNSDAVKGGQGHAANALELANKLISIFQLKSTLPPQFQIKARSAVTDLGPVIPGFQICFDETPYEVIARVAQFCGYLVYEDEYGALVLDRVGTNQHISGFAQGVNIEAASSSLAADQRFSDYNILLNSIAQASELGPFSNLRASVRDATAPRYRPRNIISEQTRTSTSTDPQQVALTRANWELARRIGRSQAIQVTCNSWRDANGYLWTPNWLAPITAPALKLPSALWIIGSVTFRKDSSGTHADLVLMPPAAFEPEPTALYLFDREIENAVPVAGYAETNAAYRNVGLNQ